MYCQNCGKEGNGNFCTNCGNGISQNLTNSPRYLPALGLIFLIYASSTGQYLNNPETYNTAFIWGFLDTVTFTVIFLFFPFIIRIIKKRKFEYREGKNICVTNSILLFIISLILQLAIGIGFTGGLGALVYYFINMFLLSEKKNKYIEEKVKKENQLYKHDYTFIPNPNLTDKENLTMHFSQMNICALKNLIETKKDEYTEETYNIAIEQYKLRSSELEQLNEQEKIKKEITELDEVLLNSNQMLTQAKKDLGNLTVTDVENMYRQKLISEAQKNEMINSVEALQTIITMTPQNIESTQKLKSELETKLNSLLKI